MSFMQGIYTHIPETNYVAREYSVAAILLLLFMVLLLLLLLLLILLFVISTLVTGLPGSSLEPAVIPTAQASSFTLQYFPYYV